MQKINLNKGWDYRQAESWWSPPERIKIDLPHDYGIEQPRDPNTPGVNCTGYFQGGIITYSKDIQAPEEWKEKTVTLEIEGAYMNAVVKLNGNIIKKQPYGYTTFHAELDKYLKYGENNVIEVKVTNDTRNSRWYSGTGLYRPVRLLVADKLHIKPWGTFITTRNVPRDNALVRINTSLSDTDAVSGKIKVCYEIVAPDGSKAAEWSELINYPECKETVTEAWLENPSLWDTENPALYKLVTKIKDENGYEYDASEEFFGVREISVSTGMGFTLNGKTIKLKGGCLHHDNGIIGAASYKSSEERKVKILKNAGFNAVRCAHNPPSIAFLDACDRLGLLVIDEIFDCWLDNKTPYDYSMHFEDWWERDFEAMLLRDRNHPSIIAWSTGNEVAERGGKSDGYVWAQKLADFTRKYDDTRFITNAANDIRGDLEGLAANIENISAKGEYGALTEKFFEPLDVAGYNYLHVRYKQDSELFPNRVICGLESFPLMVYENWEEINALPNVIGDFLWTAIDYFGEAGVGHVWYNGQTGFLGLYPWHISNCGDFDICGFKRPQSYYRDAVWGQGNVPYIAVYRPDIDHADGEISRWGWADVISAWEFEGYENQNIDIEVYCSCDEVEMFLNGKSIGKKICGKENRFKVKFTAPYEAGTLTAAGYSKNGEKQGEYTLVTPDKPHKFKLTPEEHDNKEQSDLYYVQIELVDENNNPVKFSDREITAEVIGGRLLALGSSDPQSEEMYNQCTRTLYQGRALAVIIPENPDNGEVKLKIRASGIEESECII